MTDTVTDLARRLAVGRKSDGRSVYDEAAKAELVQLCRQPGASVSLLARQCGINANQVWRWMREDAQRRQAGTANVACASASSAAVKSPFIELPLVISSPPATAPAVAATLHLQAQLPDGVRLDLPLLDPQHLADVVAALGRIRCSASTRT